MKVLYFAWLRERVGVPEEDVLFPDTVTTVAEAITHLAGRGEAHAHALKRFSARCRDRSMSFV